MIRYALACFILLCNISFAHAQSADSLCQNRQSDTSLSVSLRPTFSFKQTYTPAAFMVAGVGTTIWDNKESLKYEIAEGRAKHFPTFHTKVDDYLQYSPVVIAYGLDAFGIPSKTDFTNRSIILLKGELLMVGSVTLLKHITHEQRPDGSNFQSFPSGHTAQAFAVAAFLSEEYKGRFKWMPYVAYGLASGAGILRVANDKHYIGDVLMGAGLGILSMKIAYWTHQYHWGKKRHP